MIDLKGLPAPAIIETFVFEAILAERIADLAARLREAGVDYDVGDLETDPLKISHEVGTYREVLLRTRINEAAKANLLAFAKGSDLDHLAVFYDVMRLNGEQDEALRDRVVLAIQARSPGGSSYWYAAAARRADVRIRDVVVYREDFLPIIHVAVLSSENGGIPDQAMLDAVSAEVQSDRVRLLNDTVIVDAAVTQTIDIEADIWLLPSAPVAVFDGLAATLRAAWTEETGIGFDLEPSWIESRLHVAGVKKVRVSRPASPVIAAPGTAVSIGAIRLNFMGRDY